jgi:putative colanic acid biosynthesis UDP-glucose lipid carrier transferase
MAGDLIRRIRQTEWHRDLELVGLFDDAAGAATGTVEDLRKLAQTRRVDLIVLALPWSRSEAIFELGDRLQWISADVVAPLEQPGFLSRSSALTQVAGLPALQLTRHPFRGTQGLVKQAQDYLVAACALILTAPLMAGAALALALAGDGPVLFRQDRIGFNGRPFSIYKLRTMSADPSDDGAGGQVRGNPRITRIGALLRRTSVDELPQLLNVLRGEMSIVGPRPHVAGMRVDGNPYAEVVRTYAARHQIKPGITGWAQINGMRGGIDTLEKARRGVDLDLDYMRNWSLQLDLSIMARTLTRHMVGPQVF